MKVLLLSDPSNTHTVKWANALAGKGIDVYLFGLSEFDPSPYNSKIKIENLNVPLSIKNRLNGDILKLIYFIKLPALRKIIKTFKPDIVHAHYAASYGFIGALAGFHPYLVSVWGIDVFIFPNVSFVHKKIVKHALAKADGITSTSNVMAAEAKKYTGKSIKVIPFGIDLNIFKPEKVDSQFSDDDIVIGTVKHLEYKYGLIYLLEAFALLVKKQPELPLKLLIVGGGSMERKLKEYAEELGISDKTVFTGAVPHNKITGYHNMMDVEVYLSDYESFGVSVVEALACEKPVVVSNVGGLPEVVDDEKSGFIVPPKNPLKASEAIGKLVIDNNLRKQFGKAGREKVEKYYNWDDNVEEMIKVYEQLLK